MPFKVFESENKFLVFKIDADGKKIFPPRGSHDTHEEANAQIETLDNSESQEDKKKLASRDEQSKQAENMTAQSMHGPTGLMSQPGIEERARMLNEEETKMPFATSFEELDTEQMAIEASKTAQDLSARFGFLSKNILNNPVIVDKASAMINLAKEFATRIKEGMKQKESDTEEGSTKEEEESKQDEKELKQKVTKREDGIDFPASDFAFVPEPDKPNTWKLRMAQDRPGNITRSQLGNAAAAFSPGGFRGQQVKLPSDKVAGVKQKLRAEYKKLDVSEEDIPTSIKESSLHIWKQADGNYCWLAAYSNNYRDNDNPAEIISEASHKEFDEALSNGEWPMPEAWLWHVPYAVGITEYHAYDESTGFAIAAGSFYKDKGWAAEGLVEANWDGASHGMPKSEIKREPSDSTIITRHRTKEISFLLPEVAANKMSFTSIINKEMIMDQKTMDQKGIPSYKRDEFVKAFGPDRIAEMEETMSNQAKEANEANTEQKDIEQEKEEQTETPLTRQEVFDVVSVLANEVKALAEVVVGLKKEQDTKEETPATTLIEMLKAQSAIGSPETQVDGRSKEAKDGPKETKLTEGTTGYPVIDDLMAQNQEYYNNGR